MIRNREKPRRLPTLIAFVGRAAVSHLIMFSEKLFQNPERYSDAYVKPGWTVLDVGPGMGYFTIPLAKLVGVTGKVIAADLQQQMLDGIQHRAIKAGVQERIQLHLTRQTASVSTTLLIFVSLSGWSTRFRTEIISKRDIFKTETGWTNANRRTPACRFRRQTLIKLSKSPKCRVICRRSTPGYF